MEVITDQPYVKKPHVKRYTGGGKLNFRNNVLFILVDLAQINLFSKWICFGSVTSLIHVSFENVLVS